MKVMTTTNILAVSCAVWALGLASAWAQGSLTPPGAPAPTMKTLDQIEARVPISSLPLTISTPGSWYLTTNLTGTAGQSGITISCDDVTLDLNGFTMRGVPGSLVGISVSTTRHNITIRNGVVREWGLHGIDASSARNSSLERLRAYTNGWESTSQHGLRIGFNGRVAGCQSEGNRSRGIDAANGCTITDATAANNGGDGIHASSGCTITAATAYNNDGVGVYANDGGTITDSTAASNGGDGIHASYGCRVSRCTAELNTGDGIEVAADCAVLNNTCYSNGSGGDGAGIHATSSDNRIDSNNVTDNDRGIDVDSSGNIILRNTASGNATPYDIVVGNHDAQVISSPGSAFVSTDPWANFSF